MARSRAVELTTSSRRVPRLDAHGEVYPIKNTTLVAAECTCDEGAAAETTGTISRALAYANFCATTFPGTGTTRSAQSTPPGYALTVHAGLSCLADQGAALLGPTLATAALALTLHALLPLRTAVEALATVALVCLKVYAPVVLAAGPARGAAANLVVSPSDAVPRAALGVGCTHSTGQPRKSTSPEIGCRVTSI